MIKDKRMVYLSSGFTSEEEANDFAHLQYAHGFDDTLYVFFDPQQNKTMPWYILRHFRAKSQSDHDLLRDATGNGESGFFTHGIPKSMKIINKPR